MSFIVVTGVKYSPMFEQEVLDLGEQSRPVAKRQPGLQAFRFHQSHEGNETMMYWQWDTQEAHTACMASDNRGYTNITV